MANNSILTSDVITAETLIDLQNELTLTMTCNRRWEQEFDKGEYQKGDTVNVRLPVQYIAGDGRTATAQDTIENSTPFTVQHQPHVMVEFNSKDLTLSIDRFKERYTRQIARSLANKIDTIIASYLTDFYYWYGEPGSTISTFERVNNMRAYMSKLAIPAYDRYLGLSFDDSAGLGNFFANGTVFTPRFNDEVKEDAQLGTMAKFDVYQGSHFVEHVSGTGAGGDPVGGIIAAGAVDVAVVSGSSIQIKGLPGTTDGTFLKGDVIRIISSGLRIVNVKDHQAIDAPPQFVVTADAPQTSAGGITTIQVAPSINTDVNSPYQNTSIPIPVDAEVELAATHRVNVAYNKEAIAIVSPKLILPQGCPNKAWIRDEETGLGLRMTEEYNQSEDRNTWRFDLLLGVKVFPQLGIRAVA